MKISTFANQMDNVPSQGDATWDQIVQGLGDVRPAPCTTLDCRRNECPHKSGLAWSPASWPLGAKRGKKNVEAVSALVLDLDHVPPAELPTHLAKLSEYRHVITSSHSDRPDDRCLRVVVAVTRPITGPEFPRFWTASIAVLGLPVDSSTRDPSRLYYLPSRPSDSTQLAIDGTGFLYYTQDGAELDVDVVLAAAPPAPEELIAEYDDYVVPDFNGAPATEKQIEAARVLANVWPNAGRHTAQLALAGALARAGWPVELIADFCAAVAHIQQPGNADLDKRLAAARSSVEKVQTGEAIAGWPTVIGIVGEEAVSKARELLGLNTAPEIDASFVEKFKSLIKPAQVVEDDFIAKVKAPKAPAPQYTNPPVATASVTAVGGHDPAAVTAGTGLIDPSALVLLPVEDTAPAALEWAPAPAASVPPPTQLDLDAELKSAAKRLSSRKDANAIRDAELIKRVNRGEMLTDAADADRATMLAYATLAVVRAAPPGTTDDQILRKLTPSAGSLIDEVPNFIVQAREAAAHMGSLYQRRSSSVNSSEPEKEATPDDQFELEMTGNRQGKPTAGSQRNFDIALAKLGVTFHYDSFAHRKLIERGGQRAVVEDHHVAGLMCEIERLFDFYPPKDKFYDYCTVKSRLNEFHPILDYLGTLPSVPTIDESNLLTETWLIQFGGAKDTPYVRAISRLVLVAAIRRVRQPGCKFDEMVILEGKQGSQKSTALKKLCPNIEWFADNFHLDGDTKKMMEVTTGKWIVEAGELKGMSQGDHNAMKAYLSSQFDEARMAYGREKMRVPRQFIVIGTTNDSQYLKDKTGDRRYWPVEITRMFDIDGLLAIRDALWAEAAYLDLAHPEDDYIRLHPSLYADAAAEQEKRQVDDPVLTIIEDVLGQQVGRIRTQDVWKLLGYTERHPNKSEAQHIAATMQQLGFERKRIMIGGERPYYYMRGNAAEREILISIIGSAAQGWNVKVTAPNPAAPSSSPPLGLGQERTN